MYELLSPLAHMDEDVDPQSHNKKLMENQKLVATFAFFPFSAILVAFCVLLCFRKIEDYYLKKTIWFLFLALTLRTATYSIIVYGIDSVSEHNENQTVF